MTRLVGYTRQLAPDLDPAPDVAALAAVGVVQVFVDDQTTDPRKRPALTGCLAFLEAGDVLVVRSAAHLSHAVTHFVSTVAALTARGVEFR